MTDQELYEMLTLPDCQVIPLNKYYLTVVDEADYEWLSRWRWSFNSGYASRSTTVGNKSVGLYMARVILDAPAGLWVDHINRNKLDNRRSNLRLVTPAQNNWNRKPQGVSSSFKGVHLHKQTGRWQARIHEEGRSVYLGSFATEREAAQAYDAAAKRVHGSFAVLNDYSSRRVFQLDQKK